MPARATAIRWRAIRASGLFVRAWSRARSKDHGPLRPVARAPQACPQRERTLDVHHLLFFLGQHHKIGREELSVREHMGIILRLLRSRRGFVQFETMFDPLMGVAGLVVHFLAMLELAREKLIEFTQTEAFQPIYVRVHQGGSEPGQENS